MTTRILPAVGDPDAARSVTTLLSQLPDAEPAAPVGDSTQLIDTLARLAGEAIEELPEVVLVHERIGPVPALELIREVSLRFPAVGVVLITADASPGLFAASMDAGARGLATLPLSYEELANRVQAAALWSTGVRRHLGTGGDVFTGPGGTVVTVTGAKGGVGATVTAVQLGPGRAGLRLHRRTRRPGPPDRRHRRLPRRAVPAFRRRPGRHHRHIPAGPLRRRVLPRQRPGAAAGPRGGGTRRGGQRPRGPPDRQRPALTVRGRRHRLRKPDERGQRRGDRDGRHRRAGDDTGRRRRAGRQAHRTDVGPPPDPQGGGDGHPRQPLQPQHGDPAAAHPADHRHPDVGHGGPGELQGTPGRGGLRPDARTGPTLHRETGPLGPGGRARTGEACPGSGAARRRHAARRQGLDRGP